MYQFYMDGVLLPVTPKSMTLKISNQNETITLINEGEVNIAKRPGLSKISFEALLPNRLYPFALYKDGFRGAQYYLSLLEKLKTDCRCFSFDVIRTDSGGELLMESNSMDVSLETYEIEEDAEEYGTDISVKIELLQYRTYGTKKIEFKKKDGQTSAVVSAQRDASAKEKKDTYTVKNGDSLWGIARTELGDGGRFREIYTLNADTIEAEAKKRGRSSSSEGHWIYPGSVLRLPS